ncbi:MAG: hypothetical protein ABSC76_13385 [Terracidiphilus sp.]|jgi:hypothetical protein
MQSSSQGASVYAPAPAGSIELPSQKDDRAYQVVTVAAILLVLGSLWVF